MIKKIDFEQSKKIIGGNSETHTYTKASDGRCWDNYRLTDKHGNLLDSHMQVVPDSYCK